MAYVLKTNLSNRANYGSARDVSKIKYIVIHYTANDGDTDENNGKYFKNNIVKASAHYFVDDDSVTQSVPDNYAAWAVGGNKYASCSTTGGGKYHGICTNTNSLSIEICDDVKNGVIYPSAATIENAIALTKEKMKEYNVPADRVIRHFDVVGKICPAYWCGNAEKDAKWKTEFWNKLTESASTSTSTAATTTPTATAPTRNYLMKGDKGDAVKAMQTNLIYMGYSCGSAGADGSFGQGTDSALRKFQKDYKLTVDGKYGATSKAKLEAAVAEKKAAAQKPVVTPAPTTTYTKTQFIKDVQSAIGAKVDGVAGAETLSKTVTVSKSKNNRHAVVKAIQKYLNANGYNSGTPDGVAGAKFDAAIKAFQKANGCVVDGEVTKSGKTWRKLLGLA